MASLHALPLPLRHVGSVNAWLLCGDPLTLVDTGPRTDEALAALERGLRARQVRLEDIELVIATHHHHDHVGLAATIRRRSGARLAVPAGAADYVAAYPQRVAQDCAFARELMRVNGVPAELLGHADALWEYIAATAEAFEPDLRLNDGDRIRAGGRDLELVARPGHSATDTLLVDAEARMALVGDHVLARISPNTEIYRTAPPGPERSRSRVEYLAGLRRTAAMGLECLLPGHGPPVLAARALIKRQVAQHRRRCRRIIELLGGEGPTTAFGLGSQMWSDSIVREQPLLVLWEVLGHLDLMVTAGIVAEGSAETGHIRYALARAESGHRRPNRGRDVVGAR